MRQCLLYVLMMICLIPLSGCATTGSKSPTTASAQRFSNVDANQFEQLSRQPDTIILDVRTPDEYASGHLPRAVSMDLRSPEFVTRASQLDKSKTYLVHCRTGMRGTSACKLLADMGFTRLYNLSGGISAWEDAGKPVVKE